MISPKASPESGRFRTRFRAVPFIDFPFGLRLVEVPLRFRTVPHMKNQHFSFAAMPAYRARRWATRWRREEGRHGPRPAGTGGRSDCSAASGCRPGSGEKKKDTPRDPPAAAGGMAARRQAGGGPAAARRRRHSPRTAGQWPTGQVLDGGLRPGVGKRPGRGGRRAVARNATTSDKGLRHVTSKAKCYKII